MTKASFTCYVSVRELMKFLPIGSPMLTGFVNVLFVNCLTWYSVCSVSFILKLVLARKLGCVIIILLFAFLHVVNCKMAINSPAHTDDRSSSFFCYVQAMFILNVPINEPVDISQMLTVIRVYCLSSALLKYFLNLRRQILTYQYFRLPAQVPNRVPI